MELVSTSDEADSEIFDPGAKIEPVKCMTDTLHVVFVDRLDG